MLNRSVFQSPDIVIIVSVIFIIIPGIVLAEAKNPSFSLSPAVLDSKDNLGATLGLEYKLDGKINKSISTNDSGSETIDVDADINEINLSYNASGTITAHKETNPKNLLEFQLDLKGLHSDSTFGSEALGIFTKYETNQAFSNHNIIFGLRGTYGKYGLFGLLKNNFVSVDAKLGRVDPNGDKDREVALGTSDLAGYYRWDLEFLFMQPISWQFIETFEFDYRHFIENSAPSTVKNANLDIHKFATFRIGLSKNMYIAYSNGKLPFNNKNEQIYELGFTYKLEK